MNLLGIIAVIVGLSLFEVVSSIDNAIINGEVLSSMSKRARRWFLLWGIIIAVFLVRGLLPFAIVLAGNAQLGVTELIKLMISAPTRTLLNCLRSLHLYCLLVAGFFLSFSFSTGFSLSQSITG